MSGAYATPYTAADTHPMPPAQPQHVLAQQDQIIRQQDQSLEQLSRSVATLHNLGHEIHGELRTQGALLDDLEHGVDQTRDALVSQQSRLKRLLKRTKDNWLFCAISAPPPTHAPASQTAFCSLWLTRPIASCTVLLCVVLGVILYFVISSPS